MTQHMIVWSAPYNCLFCFGTSVHILRILVQYSTLFASHIITLFSEHTFLLLFPKEVRTAHLFSKMLVGYISWSISSSTSRNFWWCHMHSFLNLNIQIYSFLLVSHCPNASLVNDLQFTSLYGNCLAKSIPGSLSTQKYICSRQQ